MGFWAVAIPLITAAVGAYSSRKSDKEQGKISKEAAKGKQTTAVSVPYMNEYISKLVPYILSEQQKIYENRMKGYGLKPGDFSPIASLLAGIPVGYSGVGGGAGGGFSQFNAQEQQVNRLNTLSPEDRSALDDYAKQQGITTQEAARVLYGPDGLERDPGNRFDTGGGSPFFGGGFSGVPAGDAKAAGTWLVNQMKSGGTGNWLLRALLGFGGGGSGNKVTGSDGSSLFGMGEWSTKEPLK